MTKQFYNNMPKVYLFGDSHAAQLRKGSNSFLSEKIEIIGGGMCGGRFLNNAKVSINDADSIVVNSTNNKARILPPFSQLKDMLVVSTMGFNTHNFIAVNFEKEQHYSIDFLRAVVREQRQSALIFYTHLSKHNVKFFFIRAPKCSYGNYQFYYEFFEDYFAELVRELGGTEIEVGKKCFDPNSGTLLSEYIAEDGIHGTEMYAHEVFNSLIDSYSCSVK